MYILRLFLWHHVKKTNFSVNVNKFIFTQNFVLLAWYHKEQSQFVQTSIPYGPLKKPLYESKSPKICGEHIWRNSFKFQLQVFNLLFKWKMNPSDLNEILPRKSFFFSVVTWSACLFSLYHHAHALPSLNNENVGYCQQKSNCAWLFFALSSHNRPSRRRSLRRGYVWSHVQKISVGGLFAMLFEIFCYFTLRFSVISLFFNCW